MARSRWTLRRRLIVGILALLAATSIIVGAVSTLVLRSYLMDRLDNQITSAGSRFQGAAERPDGAPIHDGSDAPRPGEVLPLAGLVPGTLGGFVRAEALDGGVLDEKLQVAPLTGAQQRVILDVVRDGVPITVDLGGDLGEYRIAVTSRTPGESLVIGMPLRDVTLTVIQLALVIGVVALGALIAAFFAGTAIVRLALRPLERVAATASHVAELPLDRGDVALAVRVPSEDAVPDTEVGQVGAALNRMLDHIGAALTAREASERKVRTFVADASHELRTPLASIRGYAELTRRGGHELPEDIVHAMARIESESVRMTSLVEDLLLLARLDDGRSLEDQPVDLGALLADAVSDARVAGHDHTWRLSLPHEPLSVRGDAARLHQVVANLLTNARVHTPAGTTVTTTAVRSADGVTLTVRDTGQGIDPAVLPAVFERFARGDSSRSRAAGSTGLGLAIVQAVVTAHGGTVAVSSDASGAEFVVELPDSSARAENGDFAHDPAVS